MSFSVVHVSDLHFNQFPKTVPEWLSKRMLGSANLFFRRRKNYPLERAKALVEKLKQLQWDHLAISGDLSTLALESEFKLAQETLHPILEEESKVTIVPGNHDRYVASACTPDLFSKYFGRYFDTSGIKFTQLSPEWHLIGWDSCHPNGWLTASGTVPRSMLLRTEEYIEKHPSNAKFIIVNHFPLEFPNTHSIDYSHELYNLSQVNAWIRGQTQIRAYLHGHIHYNWHQTITRANAPTLHMVNSASSASLSLIKKASAFHRLHLKDDHVEIEPLQF